MIAHVDMVSIISHFSFSLDAAFRTLQLRSGTDLITCESELHDWVSTASILILTGTHETLALMQPLLRVVRSPPAPATVSNSAAGQGMLGEHESAECK